MKKVRLLVILTICMIALTGCVRFNTTVKVKSNGKVDISMLYAGMDMSDYGYDSDMVSDDEKQDLIDKGWSVSDYNQDGFAGYMISKEDITFEELSESISDNSSFSEDTGEISVGREGLKYIIDWKVFEDEEGAQISAFKNYITMTGGYMKFTISLPVKPTDSNATIVSDDGKTLEWNLLELGPDHTIHLEFVLINVKLLIILFIAALLIVAVIIGVILKSSNNRKAQQ
ncbi:MAG: hypothetical protein K6B14_03915 [Lachnospiraceae bacterium]|nr:hypothetical protein [Lachnospiraceae bacterium]